MKTNLENTSKTQIRQTKFVRFEWQVSYKFFAGRRKA